MTGQHTHQGRGVAASLSASVLFALLLYWATLMPSLGGLEVLGWRIVGTFVLLVAIFTAIGRMDYFAVAWARIRRSRTVLVHLFTAPMLAVQFFMFMWAPANGYAKDVSLGFFLMPLVMVPVGRVLFGDRLTRLQTIAVVLAVIGVGHELAIVGSVPWVALIPALGFPIYFAVKRAAGVSDVPGTITEFVFMLPIAVAALIVGWTPGAWSSNPALFWIVPVMGLISALAMIGYFVAADLLPFGLFGLLSYVEPALLLVVAILLGASLTASDMLTYGPIWLAITVLAVEGVLAMRQRVRTPA